MKGSRAVCANWPRRKRLGSIGKPPGSSACWQTALVVKPRQRAFPGTDQQLQGIQAAAATASSSGVGGNSGSMI